MPDGHSGSGTKKNERTFAQVLLKGRMPDGHSGNGTVSKSRRLEWLDDLKQCRDALQAVRAAKKLAAKYPSVLGGLNRDLNKAELFLARVVKSNPRAEEAVRDRKVGRLPRQSSFEMFDEIARRTKVYSDALEKIREWVERFIDSWLNGGSGGQC